MAYCSPKSMVEIYCFGPIKTISDKTSYFGKKLCLCQSTKTGKSRNTEAETKIPNQNTEILNRNIIRLLTSNNWITYKDSSISNLPVFCTFTKGVKACVTTTPGLKMLILMPFEASWRLIALAK